jgi:hypothetical protein
MLAASMHAQTQSLTCFRPSRVASSLSAAEQPHASLTQIGDENEAGPLKISREARWES